MIKDVLLLSADTKTRVKIHLTTKVEINNEIEVFELTLFGYHYLKGNTKYLTYDEVQKEGTIHTVVKITEQEVLILRSGLLNMHLSFAPFEKRNGSHDSKYGTIHLTTDTKKIDFHEIQDLCEGQLTIAYDLLMQDNYVGFYEMDITYKELKS